MRPAFNQSVALLGSLILLLGGCSDARDTDEALEDAAVTAVVKTRLAADPEVNPFEIDVDTTGGVVLLRGMVETETQRTEAENIARDTDGVIHVDNDIQLGDLTLGENINDSWISTKIKGKLAADPEINKFNIDVDVLRGVVTLSGIVKTERAKQEAEHLARDTKGVTDVRNLIEVQG